MSPRTEKVADYVLAVAIAAALVALLYRYFT